MSELPDGGTCPPPDAHARERLALLAMAGEVFARSLDREETLDAIARTVVPRIADWCRVDLLDADGVLQRAVTHHQDPERTKYGQDLVRRLRAAPGAVGSMQWAVDTGRPHLAHFDPPLAHDTLRDRDLLTFAQAIGMSAYYVVPLIARGRTLGALAALQAESGRRLTPDDCATLDELGHRAALALDNARLYSEAQAARREAERASRAKDEFLGILGHELRNPLAPIVMALHAMQKQDDTRSAPQRRIIERQVMHLTRLVDDLLDVSRITQGKIELARERVDLRGVAARAIELTHPMFERRARAVEVDLPESPCVVWGDDVRLAQILANLLINAAKFTADPGAIRLRLTTDAQEARVEVSDEGVGIDAGLVPHVFDVFVQGKQSIDRRAGGLGLGLAIVKTLAQLHGGRVEAHSEGPGRGSVFRVCLPLAESGDAAALSPPRQEPPQRKRSGRILVVDDNRDAAATLALMLELAGYEVAATHDGIAALAIASTFAADVAILDIGLPGMDGYALAAKLVGQSQVPPRLLALTGYGTAHDRARALAAGFADHLVKPVTPEALLSVLDRLLDSGARR